MSANWKDLERFVKGRNMSADWMVLERFCKRKQIFLKIGRI